MHHRFAVLIMAAAIMLSAVPLYRAAPQEFTPRNMDEGEFEVNAIAPEGTSINAMEGVAEQIETELQKVKAARVLLITTGGNFLDGVNRVRAYIRLAPHDERVFRFKRLLQWPPWKAWQGNYSQAEVIQEVRHRLKKCLEGGHIPPHREGPVKGHRGEVPLLQAGEAHGGAKPQRAVLRLADRSDLIIGQSIGGGIIHKPLPVPT